MAAIKGENSPLLQMNLTVWLGKSMLASLLLTLLQLLWSAACLADALNLELESLAKKLAQADSLMRQSESERAAVIYADICKTQPLAGSGPARHKHENENQADNLKIESIKNSARLTLSDICSARGNYQLAEAYCWQAVKSIEENFGANSPRLVPALRNLAACQDAQFNLPAFKKAALSMQRKLALQEKVLNDDCAYMQKELEHTWPVYSRARMPEQVTVLKRIAKYDEPVSSDAGMSSHHLAYALLVEGKAKEALPYAEKAYKYICNRKGDDCIWALRSKNEIAAAKYLLGDAGQAKRLVAEAQQKAAESLDKDAAFNFRIQTISELATCSVKDPTLEMARKLQSEAESQAFPDNTKESIYGCLAGVYKKFGTPEEYEKVKAVRKELGEKKKWQKS